MLTFNELKRNAKKETTGLTEIKVAVLGESATQLLINALKGYGIEKEFNFDIYESDFDQLDSQTIDPGSDLYSHNPHYVILVLSTFKLLKSFYSNSFEEKANFTKVYLERIQHIVSNIHQNCTAKIIITNFAEIDDGVFGQFANKTDVSFLFHNRCINVELMKMSQGIKNLFIADVSSIQNQNGLIQFQDPKLYINAEMDFSIDTLPFIAKSMVDIICANQGKFAKCLILDLDNTTWGGIIGDDGMEGIQIGALGIGKAFTLLQKWVKQLKERGIILAVCSKNSEEVAKEPFEKHPDMVLKLEDIAVFVSNWETKVDNIRYIQSILNISFDSMVFLDDNPFERNIVKENIPEVIVPDLPKDPAEYFSFLSSQNLFETASFSANDNIRTKQYQEEAKRKVFERQFNGLGDYLNNLEMKSEVKTFNSFTIPRIAQLSQRSNQFNLRTIRYAEEDIKRIQSEKNNITFSIALKDKFGDHGIICAIIMLPRNEKELFIDTWIMSCRVLKRGVEDFTLNKIVEFARNRGYARIIGEYVPTKKNTLVKNLFKDLGFKPNNDFWVLDIISYKNKSTYIK